MTQKDAYLCPGCRRELRRDANGTLVCSAGHRFAFEEEVLVLLEESFLTRLKAFIVVLEDFRSRLGRRLLDETVYDTLPHGEAAKGDFEWRLRCYDLTLIRRHLSKGMRRRVLDIGCHNGWLSRHLADDGHDVTAIDYFNDPYDGLGARKFYTRPGWRAIQMDLRDLSILNRAYDAIVLNRCLQFFSDPTVYLEHVRRRLAPGGLIILTGLDFYKNPATKRANLARLKKEHKERYGVDFFLHPTRGYLDFHDRRRLQAKGVVLRSYPRLRHRTLAALAVPTRPRFCYGTWHPS